MKTTASPSQQRRNAAAEAARQVAAAKVAEAVAAHAARLAAIRSSLTPSN